MRILQRSPYFLPDEWEQSTGSRLRRRPGELALLSG